jgi:hypothetical protein
MNAPTHAAAATKAVPPATPPEVRAWWPGRGVLVVTAQAHWMSSQEPAALEVTSDALAGWKSAVKSAVVLARLTEPVDPTGVRVTLTLSLQAIGPAQPNQAEPARAEEESIGRALAASAAVLADRAVRGLLHLPPAPTWVLATSEGWERGALQPLPEPWLARSLQWLRDNAADQRAYLALPGGLPHDAPTPWRAVSHVNQLHGQLPGGTQQRGAVRWFETWFPTIGARGPELNSVRVVVTPVANRSPGPVEVLGTTDRNIKARALAVLATVRRHDRGGKRWNTWVHFSGFSFEGRSFELALAVADRIARGREWPGQGRVLATGAVDDVTGSVLNVDERPPLAGGASPGGTGKLDLLQREARLYDTLLLPQAWDDQPPGYPHNNVGGHGLRFEGLPPAPEYAQPQVIYLAALPH